MPSSCKRAAIYKVTWHWAGQERDGATLEMGVHTDSPVMTLPEPWIGSLCEHELGVLRGENPGAALSGSWSFDIETLFDAASPARPMTPKEAREEYDSVTTQARAPDLPINDALKLLRRAAELQGMYGL